MKSTAVASIAHRNRDPSSIALVKLTPFSVALSKLDPRKSAPRKLLPERSAPSKLARERFASGRSTSRSTTPRKSRRPLAYWLNRSVESTKSSLSQNTQINRASRSRLQTRQQQAGERHE